MRAAHDRKGVARFSFVTEMPTSKGMFAERVLRARLMAGAQRGRALSQGEVADAVGVTQSTVSQWEKGAQEPPLATLTALARVLGVSAGYLAFGEGVQGTALDPAHDHKLSAAEIAAARKRRRPKA